MSSERPVSRFDDFTRALATGASRRTALKALAASAGAVMVGWLGAGRAEAGDEDPDGGCRANGTVCRFKRQCCSRNCVDAQCKCRGNGVLCRSSAQCCSTRCEKGICDCQNFGETCKSDVECCPDGGKGPNGKRRPGPAGGKGFNVTCQNGTCTCQFPGDFCSTTEDCCFSNNICFKGQCVFP